MGKEVCIILRCATSGLYGTEEVGNRLATLYQLFSTLFISRHTYKVLKESRHTVDFFFTIDKTHHAAGRGFKSPNCPITNDPPKSPTAHLQTIHSTVENLLLVFCSPFAVLHSVCYFSLLFHFISPALK